MPKLPLSLVVMTHNEAASIARCLDSVPFAAEKLVIDCGSTDGTDEIAMRHGARVVQQDWLGFGPQRNFGTTQCQHDWVLALDADEYLSPELISEMERRLPEVMASDTAVVTLRRRTLYMGAPMRWYRPMVGEKLNRLYHRERARWRDVRVHESLTWNGPQALLQSPFEHVNNPTLVHKGLKVLRYAELKARDWHQHKRSPRMWDCPLVFASSFIKDYVFRLAALDGWRGFVVAQTNAAYAVYKRMRYYEMCRNPESMELAAGKLTQHELDR
ncbi:glycosyltransferase family 2 protein [Rhodanobacter sp. AS-Z3]|uniref:glycosyltransferase family 2 protein n=1 Tax=Rhodanobacter sp. AS-Z3 TaxID=3031330 RepID=UPI00247A464B|nr:glycosyltransferase family 2 protein [Rhodanobacter sp. AS-Z3]WEN15738.1 glycosyltransferase family 2 protein [Rhodanobacter sp. AS-Z3]